MAKAGPAGMSTTASPENAEADEKPAVMKEFVTLVVTDDEGRRLTRTMRTTDQLQVLMDFYYAMVPTVKDGEGIFEQRRNRRIEGAGTPAYYRMKDGDEIQFSPPIDLVTPVLQDFRGRSFTRTMRKTDRMQDLMGFYADMVTAAAPGIFLYRGERVMGEQTPAGLGIKDWDRIYVVPRLPGKVEKEKEPDIYVTLKVQDTGGHRVYRTMRRTEKVKTLMDFYGDVVSDVQDADRFRFIGGRLSAWETPEDLYMEDGDEVDCFPEEFCPICSGLEDAA